MDQQTIMAIFGSLGAVVSVVFGYLMKSQKDQIDDLRKQRNDLLTTLSNYLEAKSETDSDGAEIWRELRGDLKDITSALGKNSGVQDQLNACLLRLKELLDHAGIHLETGETSLKTLQALVARILKGDGK